MTITLKQVRFILKPIAHVLLLLPALWLANEWWAAYQGLPNGLGFNPQETSNRFSGDWAIRILLLALAITPLAKLVKMPKLLLFRRMVGLYAFFYVCLHMLSYIWLDKFFNWPELWSDVMKRTYITVGMAAFILLVPLAVTSTKGWIRRLSAKRWQKLHKSVYVIGALACLHFVMMRKGWQVEPLIYTAIYGLLMFMRFRRTRKIDI